MASKDRALVKAIGVQKLTEYFVYLDDLRESGITNMYGAAAYLMDEYPGMDKKEAVQVLGAWMETFSNTLPVEDRADKVVGE